MTDLQALFHNPNSFEDKDLAKVKSTLTSQRYTVNMFMVGGAGAMYWLKPTHKYVIPRVALGWFVGMAVGGYLAYKQIPSDTPSRFSKSAQSSMDKQILSAFEKRYVDLSLNACGFGNNGLSIQQDGRHTPFQLQKPY